MHRTYSIEWDMSIEAMHLRQAPILSKLSFQSRIDRERENHSVLRLDNDIIDSE